VTREAKGYRTIPTRSAGPRACASETWDRSTGGKTGGGSPASEAIEDSMLCTVRCTIWWSRFRLTEPFSLSK